jgi:hypothetical protein
MTSIPIPLAARKSYAKKFPWVEWSAIAAQCEGYHAKSEGKRACKVAAHWIFTHHKVRAYTAAAKAYRCHEGEVRRYCWNHLFSRGFYGDMCEEARTDRWMKRNPPPWRAS